MTNTDTPIPWGRYSADETERLIAALLLRLHPKARRVDGVGGDDGVDVLLPVDGGIHVFEIKSYHERLKAPQKRAIAKSAQTAAAKNPDMVAWTLVLPLEHSPAERSWMNKDLAALTGVPVDWIGRTKLEVQLGEYPDIMRSFAPGNVEHLAFQMLSEHGHEQAIPPRTFGDVVKRAQRLAEQADVVDPFYSLGISIQRGSVTLTAWPKDEKAPPLYSEVAFQAEAGSPQAAAIEEFMNYGRPMTVEAGNIADMAVELPAGMRDLMPEGMRPRQVKVIATEIEENARLDAVNESGRVLGALSMVFSEASRGPRGGLFRAGYDRSGFLYVAMKMGANGTSGEFEVASRFQEGLLPADVLPALRFLDALRRAVEVRLTVGGQTHPARIPDAGNRITGVENMKRMAEALEKIGQCTGVVIPVPARWSDDDGLNVGFWHQLVVEGQAPYPTPEVTHQVPVATVRQILDQGMLPRLSMTGRQNRPAVLLGVEIGLEGLVRFETSGLLVANPAALARECQVAAPSAYLELRLVPDEQTTTVFYLEHGPQEDAPPSSPSMALENDDDL